jgi:flagellar basal body-associated protein FliL
MTPKSKKALKIIIMLGIIWFAAALPVPFLWFSPTPQQSQQYWTYLEIAAIVSIPFIGLGIVWTLRPEITTRG